MTAYVGCTWSYTVDITESDGTPLVDDLNDYDLEATIERHDNSDISAELSVGSGLAITGTDRLTFSLTEAQTEALGEGWLPPRPQRLVGALYRTDSGRTLLFEFYENLIRAPGATS